MMLLLFPTPKRGIASKHDGGNMMDAFLWYSSTLIMLALLLLLAARAFQELLGIQLIDLMRWRKAIRFLSPSRWPWPLVLIVSLAVLWLGSFAAYAALKGPGGFFQHFWLRFTKAGDASHYLFIAEHGYVSSGEEINKIVFFPLYPLLIGMLGRLLGGHFALAGLIVSQASYGASAVMLLRLAKLDSKHPDTVLLAYWLYPLGFFCLGVFSEGLFLLLTILGFYFIRTRRWILAGIAGLLCALTRTQGVLLLLPGVYCAWQDCRKSGWNWRYLALLGSAAGFGIYLVINRIVCGDFFAYLYYESAAPWWQTAQWLGDTVVQQWNMALNHPSLASWIYWPQLLLYYIIAALLFWGYRRRLKTDYILYGTAYLGMCYTPSWLISGCRYLYGCVPAYLCIGSIKSRYARIAVLAAELVACAMFYTWYMQGQAIM